jgi:hypothetical protein
MELGLRLNCGFSLAIEAGRKQSFLPLLTRVEALAKALPIGAAPHRSLAGVGRLCGSWQQQQSFFMLLHARGDHSERVADFGLSSRA